MKRLLLALSMVSGVAFAQTKEITIVSSLPRTGSSNAQTTAMVNGIRLALEEANHTVAGAKIRYEDLDSATPERGNWDPAIEARNAQRAVADPTVVGYIGTYNSGAAKISIPILNRARLAMISPANTYPGFTKPGLGEPNEPRIYRASGLITYFRVVPADDIQGAVAARWMKELGAKSVFIVHDREVYGKGIAEVFRTTASQLGLRIDGFEGLDPRAANYRALANKIRQLQSEAIYLGGITQNNAGQFAKDIRAVGITAPLIVPDGCFEQAFIDAAGAANLNDRTYVTFGGVPADQLTGRGQEFAGRYAKRFGTPPGVYSVYAYEATRVLLTGIERAGSLEREAIVRAIGGIRDFDGALGRWSFDENGDTTLRTMSIQRVTNGAFQFIKLVE